MLRKYRLTYKKPHINGCEMLRYASNGRYMYFKLELYYSATDSSLSEVIHF